MEKLSPYLPFLQKLCFGLFILCAGTMLALSYVFTNGPTKPDTATGQVLPFDGYDKTVYFITNLDNHLFHYANTGSFLFVMLAIFVSVLRSKAAENAKREAERQKQRQAMAASIPELKD